MSPGLTLTLLPLVLMAPWRDALSQSVRITGATTLRYIEVRPFVRDSVRQDATQGAGLLRQLADGRVVRCLPGEAFCRDVRPGQAVSTIPAIHDIDATVWGLGRGTRLVAQVRGRSVVGGQSDLWPRGRDALEVMSLYGEVARDRWRVRGGRQWKVSGLGFYNFDGLSVATQPRSGLWVEAYGGRSLVRGLDEARTGAALEAVEPLSLPNAGLLLGMQARWRPNPRLALGAVYQVDFRGDGRGLYSELAVADGTWRSRLAVVESTVELDVATVTLNQARLSGRTRPLGPLVLLGEARRYRPYFELWTIWGAFSPVGFDEGRFGVTWVGDNQRLTVRGDASYRRYGGMAAAESVDSLRTSGWGVALSAGWSPVAGWTVDASTRVETGFGAARREGLLAVRRHVSEDLALALQGAAFERLYEFRLAEGKVVGFGLEGAWRLSERLRALGAAAAYRHLDAGPSTVDWTQRRASLRLEWSAGREPGMSSRRNLP